MGFSLSSITGGLGGFLGGDSSQSSAPASVWGEQSPFLKDLYERAQMASYGGMGTNYANQVNQGALPAYNNLAQGGNTFDQSGLQNIASGGAQNQYLNSAIQSGLGQLANNFNRNIMPGINTGAAMTNTSGGSRQGIAQGIAASDANQQASDFINSMQSGNYQQGIQNQLGAYNQLGQNAQMQNVAQMGALSQAPQLANLGFGSQYGDLAALGSLIGGPTILGGGSSGSSQGGVGSSLGGIASLAGVLSDRRAKENIKRVGITDSGLNVYTYNYIGNPVTHMGVMAQEVEEVIPEAVHDFNGLKTVDYTKVI